MLRRERSARATHGRAPRAALCLCALSMLLFCAGVARFCELMDACATSSTFTLAGAGAKQGDRADIERANAQLEVPVPIIAWLQDDGSPAREVDGPSDASASPATHLVTARRDADGFPVLAGDLTAKLGLPCEVRDYRLLALVAHGCLLAGPLVLAAWLLLACRRGAARPGASLGARVLFGALPLALAVAVTAVLCSTVTTFSESFPTRWADFSAWEEAARTAASHAAALAQVPAPCDVLVVEPFAHAVLCGLGAIPLLIAGMCLLGRWRVRGRARHARERS